MIIKICGITKPEDAEFAISKGANWIGIIQHSASIRYISANQAAKIAESTQKLGGVPVAVFVDSTAEEMLAFCEQTGVTHIQLHGKISRQQHHFLPSNFVRIYVRTMQQTGCALPDEDLGQKYLDPSRDYLLFDGPQAGSGQRFDWQEFAKPVDFRFLLAGGLTPENIRTAILHLQPDGVDVSSGVESLRGIKCPVLIEKFIVAAREQCKK